MKRNYTFFLLLLLVLASCKSYEVMRYDVLRPAEYSVEPEIKSIVIVDNSFPFNADNAHIAHVMGDVVRLDTVRVDTFTTVIISNLKKELALRQFFDTVYTDTVRYNTLKRGSPLKVFEPAEINAICAELNADAVLSLESAHYGTDINVQDMGEEYFATMGVSGMLFWRLYNRYEHGPVYKTSQNDTLYWSGSGSDVNRSVSSFPSLSEATVELGEYLGASFTDKIAPYWEPVARRIYNSGNPHFVGAAEWLSRGNRYEAEKLWGYIYEKGSEKEKYKAANNIAISMEAAGKLREAMEWAYKSYQICEASGALTNGEDKRAAKQLYTDLVRRYRDRKKLNIQVGGEANE